MITKFKIFENKIDKPNANSVSPEFWEMVEIADWKSVIEGYKKMNKLETDMKYSDLLEESQMRVYLKYEYEQIKEFAEECHKLYMQLYDYFEPTWLNDKYNFMPSDDCYGDLISSIIGLGKDFVINCNKNVFIKMVKNEYYVENFSYILDIYENDYWKIKEKADPFWSAVRKYNV